MIRHTMHRLLLLWLHDGGARFSRHVYQKVILQRLVALLFGFLAVARLVNLEIISLDPFMHFLSVTGQ